MFRALQKSLLILFVVPLVLGFLSACTPVESTPDRVIDPDPSGDNEGFGEEFKKASCAFPDDAGDMIQDYYPAPMIEKGPFNKKYDRAQFLQIRSAQPMEIAKFAQVHWLEVFRADTKLVDGACDYLQKVPAAPSWAQKKWKDVNAKSILGLYLSKEKLDYSTPVMIVRRDTNQYTLVHEYMHFLFNRYRVMNETDDVTLEARLKKASDAFRAAKKNGTDADVVDTFISYIYAMLPIYLNYPLEEMAVEAVMTDEFREGNLKLATDFDRKASAWYIQSKYKEITTDLSDDLSSLKKLEKAVNEDSRGVAYWGSRGAKLKDAQKQIVSILDEADTINSRYASLRSAKPSRGSREQSYELSGVVSDQELHHGHDGKCAHEAIFEKYKNQFISFK